MVVISLTPQGFHFKVQEGALLHFIMPIFTTVEWSVIFLLTADAPWPAWISEVLQLLQTHCPVCTGRMASTLSCPSGWQANTSFAFFLKELADSLSPSSIKTLLIRCSCLQLHYFEYNFLAVFPQHLSVDKLIITVKIDKYNICFKHTYAGASFGGQWYNWSVISNVLESQEFSHVCPLGHSSFTSTGHRGFVMTMAYCWWPERLCPFCWQLEIQQGFIHIITILSPWCKCPVMQAFFCSELLKRCFRAMSEVQLNSGMRTDAAFKMFKAG